MWSALLPPTPEPSPAPSSANNNVRRSSNNSTLLLTGSQPIAKTHRLLTQGGEGTRNSFSSSCQKTQNSLVNSVVPVNLRGDASQIVSATATTIDDSEAKQEFNLTAVEQEALLLFRDSQCENKNTRNVSHNAFTVVASVSGGELNQRDQFLRSLLRFSSFNHAAKRPRSDDDGSSGDGLEKFLSTIAEYLKNTSGAFSFPTVRLMIDRLCHSSPVALTRNRSALIRMFIDSVLVPGAVHRMQTLWVDSKDLKTLDITGNTKVSSCETFLERQSHWKRNFQSVVEYLQRISTSTTDGQTGAAADIIWYTIEKLCEAVSAVVYPESMENNVARDVSSLYVRISRSQVRLNSVFPLMITLIDLVKATASYQDRCWKVREIYASGVGSELTLMEAAVLDTLFAN